jgi:hypothetical protein
MAEKFQLRDEPTPKEPPVSTGAAQPEIAPAVSVPPTGGERTIAPPPVDDVEASGVHLAAGLDAAGYHPVVLFGNANSGKTSLLLSLFALVRTEPSLGTGLELGDAFVATDSLYGKYLREQAEGFFGRKTQDFIEGKASPKTAIELPFFIPVVFRPEAKPEIRFAFMESNGEWYRPDRSSEKLFPKLRQQIEDFLATYQGPITFIHLLPYTQQIVYGSGADQLTDDNEMKEASLAIAGALYAYQKARVNKQDDRHLILVTKWDAHDREELDRADILRNSGPEAEQFANERYSQAMAVFRGLGLQPYQQRLNAYCSGIIAGQIVSMPKRGDELRDAVLHYPTQLWRWLYRSTLEQLGEQPLDPFPPEPKPNWFLRLLDRLF